MTGLSLLAALAQPCVGALIGYVTNLIAIRMLFRPLRAWHVGPGGRWRVPLTPGIIPAKRLELAESIGAMVGDKLLTSETIGRALAAEPFQRHLREVLTRRIEALGRDDAAAGSPLSQCHQLKACGTDGPHPPAPLSQRARGESHPSPSGRGAGGEGPHAAKVDDIATLSEDATGVLEDTLAPVLTQVLTRAAQAALEGPRAEADLARFFKHLGGRLEAAFAEEALTRLLSGLFARLSAESAEDLGRMLTHMLRRAAADGLRLRDLAPEEGLARAQALVDAETPAILERIADELLAEKNRPALTAALVAAVYPLLDSLGPVGAVAHGFFESETFARHINHYLDQHGPGIRARLRGPDLRKRLAAVLRDSVDRLLDRRIDALLDDMAPGQLDNLCQAAANRLLVALRGPALDELAGLLAGRLVRQAQDGTAAEALARELKGYLEQEQGAALLEEAIRALCRRILRRPWSSLFRHLPAEARQRLVDLLLVQANRLLPQELPGLVQALDFRGLTRDRVASLDLLQLERLLLDIMAEQFRAISLFGALLGFLIGLVNLAFFALG